MNSEDELCIARFLQYYTFKRDSNNCKLNE